MKRHKKFNYDVEILFQLDYDVKFPLLRLLQFLNDLKSTILPIWRQSFGKVIFMDIINLLVANLTINLS